MEKKEKGRLHRKRQDTKEREQSTRRRSGEEVIVNIQKGTFEGSKKTPLKKRGGG